MDTLHTVRLPRHIGDAHHLHRMVASATDGYERPLWGYLPPGPPTRPRALLTIRSPHLDPGPLPDRVEVSTRTTLVPEVGERVVWALIANPTKSTGPRDPDTGRLIGRSKRQPLPEDQIPGWVCRKLLGPLSDLAVTGTTRLPPLVGTNPRAGNTITHTRYVMHGTGVVAAQPQLVELLAAGVGPGKAFGCGLLTVGPVG